MNGKKSEVSPPATSTDLLENEQTTAASAKEDTEMMEESKGVSSFESCLHHQTPQATFEGNQDEEDEATNVSAAPQNDQF